MRLAAPLTAGLGRPGLKFSMSVNAGFDSYASPTEAISLVLEFAEKLVARAFFSKLLSRVQSSALA